MRSAPSKSAMVRATRSTRSWDRAVRPIRSKADFISASPAASREQVLSLIHISLSVVFFFGFQFVMQLAGGLILNSNGLWESFYYLDGMESFHQMMGISIVISLVTGVIYYFITSTMLKKRLNLQ